VTSVSAHIVVPDASEASTWYTRASGAQEISPVPLAGDRATSVQVQIGESTIYLGSEFRAAGILSPAQSFGRRWNIAQKIRDVSPEQIAAAAAAIFDQPATDSRGSDG
jgi:uncharacterized glyoxalase superfamily protein PhnB